MKKKALFIIFGIVAWVNYSVAQVRFADEASEEIRQGQIMEASDQKANGILDKVYKKYDTFGSLKAKLRVTMKKNGVSSTQLGTVTVKGKKYKVETPEQIVVSDGITSWLYLKKDNSVMINRYAPNDDSFFSYPAEVLKQYQKDYIATFISDRMVNGKKVCRVDLTPFDEEGYYQRISVDIDKTTLQISKLTIYQSPTEFYTIKVDGIITNSKAIEDDHFTFDTSKVPASKIRDLR